MYANVQVCYAGSLVDREREGGGRGGGRAERGVCVCVYNSQLTVTLFDLYTIISMYGFNLSFYSIATNSLHLYAHVYLYMNYIIVCTCISIYELYYCMHMYIYI